MAESGAPAMVDMEALAKLHHENRVGNCWSDRQTWPCGAWRDAEMINALHGELLATRADVARLSMQRDEALVALMSLLAAVNVATLEDPSKHRVANTVGGPALAARQVLQKHGRLEALNRAVQDRHGPTD